MRKTTGILLVLALVLGTGGCKKNKKAKEGESQGGQTASAMSSSPRRAAAPKADVDPDVAKAVKAATQSCPKIYGLDKCEAFKPLKELRKRRKAEALKAMVSLLSLATSDNAKQNSVALYALYYGGSYAAFKEWDAHRGKVPKALVAAVIAKLPKADPNGARWGMSALSRLAGALDLGGALIKAAEALSAKDKYFPSRAVQGLMVYGRLKAFPVVKAFGSRPGGASKYTTNLSAALKAPLSMYKWTEPEFKALCPWAEQFLLSDDLNAASSAGQIVVRCGKHDPAYIDKLLAAGRKRIQTKPATWKNPVDFPFRNPCFGGMFGGLRKALKKTAASIAGKKTAPKKEGVPELCKKTYDFLAWVTKQKGVADDMKARAVMWIAYQERTKHALKWLKKLKRSKNKAVRKEAKKQIAWLKKNYLKKK